MSTRSCSAHNVAGFEMLRIRPRRDARAVLVLRHVYDMAPGDLAPLVEAMGLPASVYLPRSVLSAGARELANAPRELFEEFTPVAMPCGRSFWYLRPKSNHLRPPCLWSLPAFPRADCSLATWSCRVT
jgi:hypothetical protein